jgi:hypothetical protein
MAASGFESITVSEGNRDMAYTEVDITADVNEIVRSTTILMKHVFEAQQASGIVRRARIKDLFVQLENVNAKIKDFQATAESIRLNNE